MEVKETGIKGLIEVFPKIFKDDRGWFMESYKKSSFHEIGIIAEFVQDNMSYSKKGIVRGLHFQKPPYAQGKLVKVISGKVLDVAVDIRPGSETFGQHYSVILDAERQNMLYIPEGFAHGFASLENAVFFYKCTNLYHYESDSGIVWNDPELNIDWGIQNPEISLKDTKLQSFQLYKETIEKK
jgi:dTDP-4-dehydrorhamnose 3,5-epimerase